MKQRSYNTVSKPVVALMGEFSAGKSTLANLLLDESLSPVRVTATQLPPIWYTLGNGDPVRVNLDGTPEFLQEQNLGQVSVDDTAYVLRRSQAQVLELMDIIDMPGISDPNLSSESWQRTIQNADIVIWCSHATQAWRQSEAATWSELPERLHANSLLLLTRFDKLLTESDRHRVLTRVEHQTKGLFRGVYPIALLDALSADDDRDGWERSGADTVMQVLLDAVLELRDRTVEPQTPREVVSFSKPKADQPETSNAEVVDHGASSPIMPKRVKLRPTRGEPSARPPRSSLEEIAI